jgi:hypothetical protein
MMATRWAKRRGAALLFAFFPLLLAAGCTKPKGSLKGTVLYKDKTNNTYKLMPGGYLTFTPVEGGRTFTANIDPKDGSYAIADLPVGTLKVTVQSVRAPTGNAPSRGESSSKAAKDKSKPPSSAGIPEDLQDKFDPSKSAGKYVDIDKKYQDLATTPLEITVEKGEKTAEPIKVE